MFIIEAFIIITRDEKLLHQEGSKPLATEQDMDYLPADDENRYTSIKNN